jgi:hypothetical protein
MTSDSRAMPALITSMRSSLDFSSTACASVTNSALQEAPAGLGGRTGEPGRDVPDPVAEHARLGIPEFVLVMQQKRAVRAGRVPGPALPRDLLTLTVLACVVLAVSVVIAATTIPPRPSGHAERWNEWDLSALVRTAPPCPSARPSAHSPAHLTRQARHCVRGVFHCLCSPQLIVL